MYKKKYIYIFSEECKGEPTNSFELIVYVAFQLEWVEN